MTPLQKAARALIDKIENLGASPMDWPEHINLINAIDEDQAEATITTKTEQVAGAISKHMSIPLIQREVIEAAQYIARRYMRPATPDQQVAAPPGYALVPIEPTGEMLVATNAHPGAWTALVLQYKAMLAASQGAKP